MALVNSSNISPVEAVREMQSLQAERKNYEASHAAWLKGRDIRNVEAEAKKALEDAHKTAHSIIKAAQDSVSVIEKDKKAIAELKAQAEGALESLKAAKVASEMARQEFEKETIALRAKQKLADEQYKKHCMCEKEAKDKLDKISEFLASVNGHSH